MNVLGLGPTELVLALTGLAIVAVVGLLALARR